MKNHYKCLVHKWEIKKETVGYTYFECIACGKRKIEKNKIDYFEPANYKWLSEEA